MHNMLSEQQESLLKRGFSRRTGRIAALVGAGATLPLYNEFALAARAPADAG
jgi:hypothetical protein